MKKNLPTEAGPTSGQADVYIDTINQVFALFKRNYHNQFFKAYSNTTDLNATKRLWLDSLARFSVDAILHAAKAVIENSEYLPTLKTMINFCEDQDNSGLPDVHAAYIEACRAPSPKASHSWSHPIVYHTGKKTDWYFLQTNSEHIAYPIFKREYELLLRRVKSGEVLAAPEVLKLEKKSTDTLTREENLKRMNALKKRLKF